MRLPREACGRSSAPTNARRQPLRQVAPLSPRLPLLPRPQRVPHPTVLRLPSRFGTTAPPLPHRPRESVPTRRPQRSQPADFRPKPAEPSLPAAPGLRRVPSAPRSATAVSYTHLTLLQRLPASFRQRLVGTSQLLPNRCNPPFLPLHPIPFHLSFTYSLMRRANKAFARNSCDDEVFSLIPNRSAISLWESSSIQ